MFQKIPGNVRKDSEECSKRFRGMFEEIPGNVQGDFGKFQTGFQEMLKKIPGNAQEDSVGCWQRFLRTLKKTERFVAQLNENIIKGCILKYNQKCAQKFIKASHVDKHV